MTFVELTLKRIAECREKHYTLNMDTKNRLYPELLKALEPYSPTVKPAKAENHVTIKIKL